MSGAKLCSGPWNCCKIGSAQMHGSNAREIYRKRERERDIYIYIYIQRNIFSGLFVLGLKTIPIPNTAVAYSDPETKSVMLTAVANSQVATSWCRRKRWRDVGHKEMSFRGSQSWQHNAAYTIVNNIYIYTYVYICVYIYIYMCIYIYTYYI